MDKSRKTGRSGKETEPQPAQFPKYFFDQNDIKEVKQAPHPDSKMALGAEIGLLLAEICPPKNHYITVHKNQNNGLIMY